MITRFDIANAYRAIWGIAPIILPIQTVAPPAGDFDAFPAAPERVNTGIYGSSFYAVRNGREYYCPADINDNLTLDYPMLRISGSASIVDTTLVERKGSAHEITGLDDYKITVYGVITNEGYEFDDSRLAKYYDVLEINKSIRFRHVLTDRALHPDYQVIVKKFEIMPEKAVTNFIPYELELVSDFIYTLIKP